MARVEASLPDMSRKHYESIIRMIIKILVCCNMRQGIIASKVQKMYWMLKGLTVRRLSCLLIVFNPIGAW